MHLNFAAGGAFFWETPLTGVVHLPAPAPDFIRRLDLAESVLAVLAAIAATYAAYRFTLKRSIAWVRSFVAMPGAVEQLRQGAVIADARHRAVVEGTNMAYWETSTDGSCQYASSGLAELLGCPVAQILRMGWLYRIHPEDRERIRREYLEAMETGSAFWNEYRIVHEDGTTEWVRAEGAPGFGTEGTVGIFIGSLKRIKAPLRNYESGE